VKINTKDYAMPRLNVIGLARVALVSSAGPSGIKQQRARDNK
jgi:hypothetical protein